MDLGLKDLRPRTRFGCSREIKIKHQRSETKEQRTKNKENGDYDK